MMCNAALSAYQVAIKCNFGGSKAQLCGSSSMHPAHTTTAVCLLDERRVLQRPDGLCREEHGQAGHAYGQVGDVGIEHRACACHPLGQQLHAQPYDQVSYPLICCAGLVKLPCIAELQIVHELAMHVALCRQCELRTAERCLPVARGELTTGPEGPAL